MSLDVADELVQKAQKTKPLGMEQNRINYLNLLDLHSLKQTVRP